VCAPLATVTPARLYCSARPRQVCGVLSFCVCKVDEISAELQNPFGFDISDVGMGAMADRLREEVTQSLAVYSRGALPAGDRGRVTRAGDWLDDEKLWKEVGVGGRQRSEPTKGAVWPP